MLVMSEYLPELTCVTTPYISTTDFSGEVLLMKRLSHTANLKSTYTTATFKTKIPTLY